MKKLFLFTILILSIGSCTTYKDVQKFADKHPQEMVPFATTVLDRNPMDATRYCKANFQGEITVIYKQFDSAAYEAELAEQFAQGLNINDSLWSEAINQDFLPKDSMKLMLAHQAAYYDKAYKDKYEPIIKDLTRRANTKDVVKTTTTDSSDAKFWNMMYNGSTKDFLACKADKDKLAGENNVLIAEKRKGWNYAYATWGLLALLLVYLLGKQFNVWKALFK